MMLFKEQYKSYSDKNPLKAKILLSLFITLITFSIIRALLPVTIKFSANSWFESKNIKSTIDKVEIALFKGEFAINNIVGSSETGKGFSLGQVAVSWQWKPLFSGRAFIENIDIKGLKADSAFYANGDMNIAGLIIKANENNLENEQVMPAEQSESSPWDATVNKINFSNVELCVQQYGEQEKANFDYCAKLASFNWNGNLSFNPSTQDQSSDIVPVYAGGSLSLNGIRLTNNQLKRVLLGINSFEIKHVDIQSLSNINVESLEVQDVIALQQNAKAQSQNTQLIAFDRLTINPISLSNLNNLKLGKIVLDGTQMFLNVDKKGNTDLANWLPKKSSKKIAGQTDLKKDADKVFNYAMDEFIFKTTKHIIFTDNSLKERFAADTHSIALSLKNIDSNKPNTLSHANLSLKIDKHAALKLKADLTPLANKPSIKGTGEISGLDLRMFAPFTKQHVGHNIKSGQLDADLNIRVNKGVIESNMGLALHHFELTVLSKKEADELNSEFGFPLSSSLSLLRDRDNTIRLDIPVNGDIDNPEFDPSDAIIKASSKAITSAVIQYYTPFGLVFALGSLFDLATALNFEPVIFDANISKLNLVQEQQLNKLATLMTERPGIHLTLCGISNSADKNTLFPVVKDTNENSPEKVESIKPLSIKEINVLKNMAEARSSNVKNYMVNNKSIKASRLIECAPELKLDGISGVEISI